MAETMVNQCFACDAPLANDRDDAGIVCIERFYTNIELCPHCLGLAETYDGEYGETCMTRMNLASLITKSESIRKLRKQKLQQEDGRYRYYMLMRPPQPGAFPKGAIELKDFGQRVYIPEIGREAWAMLVYDHKLDNETIWEYELKEPGI